MNGSNTNDHHADAPLARFSPDHTAPAPASAAKQPRAKAKPRLKSDRPTQIGVAALCLAAGLIAFDLRASMIPAGTESQKPAGAQPIAAQTPATNLAEPESSAPESTLRAIVAPESEPSLAPMGTQQNKQAPAIPERITQEHTIGSGDTLSLALQKLGVPGNQAYDAITALTKQFNPRRLKAGQKLQAEFITDELGEPAVLETLRLAIDRERTALIQREESGKFKSQMHQLELTSHPSRAAGTIESSLYVAMDEAEVPHGVIAELIRIFSFDVDFQREIRSGDGFDVLYEEKRAPDGTMIRTGTIDYAALTLRGKTVGLYRYKDIDGFVGYYKADGKSSKKLLMRTPVDGARISSRYGKRRHPVLGYTKMHKGTDFAAPRGTPIMAAGDGIVEYAAPYGSFGNYVRIRHNGTYKTAYAHMNGFARGISKGKRVNQGQIIGYVGTTGRSTGPHLHYEVHKNGRQTNPLSLKLPTGKTLEGKDLVAFKSDRAKIDTVLAQVAPRGVTSVAEAE